MNASIVQLVWKANNNVLLNMINTSLKFGVVSQIFKTSTITPLQKVKGTNKADEMRPVNTLPVSEQILEEVVKTQLDRCINSNKLISPEQSGFRKNHSCESTLQHSIIRWRKNLDKSLYTGVVFIDFARAFETICRIKLLKKLHRYGLRKTVYSWFGSYLTD